MTKYCCGFVFSSDLDWVLLIQKKKPKWQAGKLNGIGGMVEKGESVFESMAREFQEEAGVDTQPLEWTGFGRYEDGESHVDFFYLVDQDDEYLKTALTRTDEQILECRVEMVTERHDCYPESLPNIPTLITHALAWIKFGGQIAGFLTLGRKF